jgi:hypothetical protein
VGGWGGGAVVVMGQMLLKYFFLPEDGFFEYGVEKVKF